MNRRFPARWASLVALVALASSANADVLYLLGGGHLEGVIVRETATSVTVDVGMGQVSLPRSRVAKIERKESPLSTYRSRLEAIVPGDAEAYALLARFASQNGLRTQSRQIWARVLAIDPTNVEAHLALEHVLLGGRYVDEEEAYRANGFVYFDGRWMSQAEQSSLLREGEQRRADDRRVEEARRTAREAEDRARRAEEEAMRARAAADTTAYPFWGYGYGSGLVIGSPYWGGYSAGCVGVACSHPPMIRPLPHPRPAVPPWPPVVPVRPASWR